MDLRWEILAGYGPLFASGLWMTVKLTIVAIGAGHHQIGNDAVGRVGKNGDQGGLGVTVRADAMTRVAEQCRRQLQDVGVIVDEVAVIAGGHRGHSTQESLFTIAVPYRDVMASALRVLLPGGKILMLTRGVSIGWKLPVRQDR